MLQKNMIEGLQEVDDSEESEEEIVLTKEQVEEATYKQKKHLEDSVYNDSYERYLNLPLDLKDYDDDSIKEIDKKIKELEK